MLLQSAAATGREHDPAKLRASHQNACRMLGHGGDGLEIDACVEALLRLQASPVEVFVGNGEDGRE